MYALAMTINHRYWERDCERHRARQVEKEALESHSWKQGKASTSVSVTASQSKANLSLVALSAKNPSSKPSPSPTPNKQPNTPQVDLSSKLASNGKLTSNKRKKRLENNLCLYYGAGDHKLDSLSRSSMMDLTFIFMFILFYFLFSFIFLFLELLGLGFISHTVTSVTN